MPPVLAPPTQAELAVPYLTPAGFTAYPTWLDLDNLIPGGVAALQANELAEALLAASDWAVCAVENMPLHAHLVSGEQLITSTGRAARARIRPRHIPLRQVISLSWGYDPTLMISDALPDSSMWIEDGRRVSFLPGGAPFTFTGPAIQFGPLPAPEITMYVTWSYVAGYPNSVLSAAAAAGATSVSVADPTGILPGDVLRIYDAGTTSSPVGASEALTVAGSYVPAVPVVPPVPAAVPLAAATQFAHAAGIGITGFPRKIIQAVIAYTVALLMREDVSAEEPASGFGPAARSTAGGRRGQAAGLVNDAYGWLAPYAPTWRS